MEPLPPSPRRGPHGMPDLSSAGAVGGVWRVGAAAARFERPPPADAARAPYKLLLLLRGSTEVHQGDRRLQLAPGHFTLLDGARDVAIEAAAFEHVLVALPRRLMLQHRPRIGRDVMQVIAPHAQRALVSDFAESLGRHAAQLPATALARSLRTLAELLDAALEAAPQSALQVSAPRLLERARTLLELSDPEPGEVDARSLAAALRISRRYLDKALAAQGLTASALIREHRLTLAGRLLRAQPSRAITDICHAVGFQDASHFTRTFRQRFGCTPSAWRASGT